MTARLARVALPMALITLGLATSKSFAEPEEADLWERHPHHISILGGLSRDSSEDGATIGLDYEYRLNRPIGLGAVAEHAFGDIKATTLLAVVDYHPWRGLAFQVGPGVEFVEGEKEENEDDEEEFVYRIGVLYEFEFGRLTFSPQVHYDFTTGADTVVAVTAVGFVY